MLTINFGLALFARDWTICRNLPTSSPMVMRPFNSRMVIPSRSFWLISKLMSGARALIIALVRQASRPPHPGSLRLSAGLERFVGAAAVNAWDVRIHGPQVRAQLAAVVNA